MDDLAEVKVNGILDLKSLENAYRDLKTENDTLRNIISYKEQQVIDLTNRIAIKLENETRFCQQCVKMTGKGKGVTHERL